MTGSLVASVAWVIINAIKYIYQIKHLEEKILHCHANQLVPLVFVLITQHLSILEDMEGTEEISFFWGKLN